MSHPRSQAPGRAPGRKGAQCPVRPPPLGEALTLWGFPVFSINSPPSLPTNSSPFLEKRDCGQGLHAAVCQAQGRRPAAGELPRGVAPPSPRRHGSSWELGTLPLFFKTGSRFITQPGLEQALGVTGVRTPHQLRCTWSGDSRVTLGTLALCWRVAAALGAAGNIRPPHSHVTWNRHTSGGQDPSDPKTLQSCLRQKALHNAQCGVRLIAETQARGH